MLAVVCDGCGSAAYVDCVPGCEKIPGAHLAGCPGANLGAAVTCAPESSCCQEGHDHTAEGNACPDVGLPFGERHDKAPCPEPEGRCVLWRNMTANARHPQYAGEPPPDACPGGHCHKDIDGCTVCRHLTITVLPGSTAVGMGG